MTTWKTLRQELNLTSEDERLIALEKELIKTIVDIRESTGLTQAQLADICGVAQPMIARLENAKHSPQLDSLLRVLVPLGYTLQIVPLKNTK